MTESDREQVLEQIIADYLAAQDAGSPPEQASLLAAHPDLAEELRAFFREHDRLGRLAAPIRAAVRWDRSGAIEPATEITSSRHGLAHETLDLASHPPEGIPQGETIIAPPDANGSRLSRGTRVRYFGDYEIREELGRGGMGVVYRTRQVSLNRPVALKMIKAGALADESELRRFQNEAEAVALLDHPGIVPVYEVGERDGQRYFTMKLIAGGSLWERLAAYKDNPRAAARLVAEVAEAVHHAAPARHPSPRHQAGQYLGRRVGKSSRDRFRPGEAGRGRCRADRLGRPPRHAGLHGTRAGQPPPRLDHDGDRRLWIGRCSTPP